MTEKPTKFELYSVFVETITANEQRRQQTSAIYLTLMSAGITILGTVEGLEPIYVIFPITIIGLIWLLSILYFRNLAQAKFSVIAQLEADWETKPFELEWAAFKVKRRSPLLRTGLTYLEMIIPSGISAAGICYLVYSGISALC